VKTTRRSRTTTHELAAAYFRLSAPGVWSIRSAGAMYGGPNDIPMHPKLEAILGALKGDNVSISEELTGSPAHCRAVSTDILHLPVRAVGTSADRLTSADGRTVLE
jgi:hypothetical protein